MQYEEFPISDFFSKITTSEQAINLLWRYKTADKEYCCPKCTDIHYYQHQKNLEIRECKSCGHQHRVRVGTIFENSKLPLLIWIRAIYLMMMGKRGVSALELQRQLQLKTYKASLFMLRKIRYALSKRDSEYNLKGIIELDGASFGKRSTGNQEQFLIAVESKEWVNHKEEVVSKAGFAKIYFGKENTANAQLFVNKDIQAGSEVHTDASPTYLEGLDNIITKSKGMYGDHERLSSWLPWVHKFISNAKTWILGTHHGVNADYIKLYLAEYTYRFNRRHDFKRYFSRTLFACLKSPPMKVS
jgi:transposase-like protein